MTAIVDRKIPDLLPLNLIARRLRIPVGWLTAEADAGRVPHLKTGRQYLGRLSAIEAVLAERAGREGIER